MSNRRAKTKVSAPEKRWHGGSMIAWIALAVSIGGQVLATGIVWGAFSTRLSRVEVDVPALEVRFNARVTALEISTSSRLQTLEQKMDNSFERLERKFDSVNDLKAEMSGVKVQLQSIGATLSRLEGSISIKK